MELPAIIITDYVMMGGSGDYLLSRLKSTPETKDIPVIVLTGQRYGDSEDVALKRDLINRRGAVAYLTKPVELDVFLGELHNHITLQNYEPSRRGNRSPAVADHSTDGTPKTGPSKKTGPSNMPALASAALERLIADGEGSHVEFKSSARWNHVKGGKDIKVELAVAKSVAGFMNADGGSLLIGLDDDGRPIGLENDFELVGKRNRDGFELWLTTFLGTCLGKTAAMNAAVSFLRIEGQEVCKVEVSAATKPVFVNAPKAKIEDEFYVRTNNQTLCLTKAEILDYEKVRWSS